MNTSTYKYGSYLHCRFRSCSFNFKNDYPFAATKVRILLKEVFAWGPTRALSGSCVVNWSLVLLLDTANTQKKNVSLSIHILIRSQYQLHSTPAVSMVIMQWTS